MGHYREEPNKPLERKTREQKPNAKKEKRKAKTRSPKTKASDVGDDDGMGRGRSDGKLSLIPVEFILAGHYVSIEWEFGQ